MFSASGLVQNGVAVRGNFFVSYFNYKLPLCILVLGSSVLSLLSPFIIHSDTSTFFVEVISALDELKKYDSGAREATKFLEQELKKGNR